MVASGNGLENLSARIKEVFIELNDYAYFHGPSEVDRLDRRFTGRRDVLERLKSLLTDHESPSGAYLVTGFRGAGKSSLVAKALAEITPPQWPSIGVRRMLRIVAPVIACSLIEIPFRPWVIVSLAVSILVLLGILMSTDPRRQDRFQESTTGPRRTGVRPEFAAWLWSALRSLALEPDRPPSSRERSLLQDALMVCTFIFITITYFDDPGVMKALWMTLAVLIVCRLPAVILPITATFPRALKDQRRAWWRQKWEALWRFRLFSRRVHIKVNLSQENLKEIDVLRMIAGSLETEYRSFARLRRPRRLAFRFLLLLPFLILAGLTYQTLFQGWSRDFTKDFHISCYLPSQGVFLLERPSDYWASIDQRRQSDFFELGSEDFRHKLEAKVKPAYKDALAKGQADGEARSTGGGTGKGEGAGEEKGNSQAAGDDGAGDDGAGDDAAETDPPPSPPAADEEIGGEDGRKPADGAKVSPGPGRPRAPHYFAHQARTGTLAGRAQAVVLDFSTGADSLVQIMGQEWILEPAPRFARRLWKSLFHSEWPTHLDYMFLVFLFLGLWLPPVVLRRFFGRLGHQDILEAMTELNEMIDAEVTQERGALPMQANTWVSVGIGRRRSQTFTVLNERDIEKRMLEILRSTQQISPLEIRPDFVVVIDELDKIQSRQPAHSMDLEPATALEPVRLESADAPLRRHITSVDSERERQQRILALVSNLKHFLSTAPAKFVFIAGREMFDAALADVSDRQFFMGSVFNEVIHVPSFHSDDSDGRLPDITSLPEEYLCRFLLPISWHYPRPSLQLYRRYLEKVILKGGGSVSDDVVEQQRDKILYELHNFVTYLTYRSNGAPKKVTSTLERFVCRLPADVRAGKTQSLIVGRSSNSLYLRFSYYDQYAFGLVTYLASPLIFSVNRAIKDYGDKILVSSSFVLDHIFKFHGHGFSWRNLELLPEVVDINRAPQLRELLGHIMRFLSRGHINEIISGLYHFKFTRRITEEIGILSKLSEHESAAFNFTLDESLALKRHFYQQLVRLLDKYKGYPNQSVPETYINSVAFLRMILGDLHYYDGEYDSALVEYMEAVQQLRSLDETTLRPDTLIILTRNFLKLGLTFERKKSFDSALLTYGRVADLISRIAKVPDWANGKDSGERRASRRSSRGPRPRLSEAFLAWMRNEPRVPSPSQPAPEPSMGLIHQVEGIRLLYQPMFARLQIAEKATLGGISMPDLQRLHRDFEDLIASAEGNHRVLIKSEFHAKLGDILFFKNGPMPKQGSPFSTVYCSSAKSSCFENTGRQTLIARGRRLPCLACLNYNRSLAMLCQSYLELEASQLTATGLLPGILASFDVRTGEGRATGDRSNFLRELSAVLSDCGDTYLSCAHVPASRARQAGSASCSIPDELLARISKLIEMSFEPRSGHLRTLQRGSTVSPRVRLLERIMHSIQEGGEGRNKKIEEALAYYAISAIVYRESSDNRAAGIQLIKILWVLREFASIAHPEVSWQSGWLLRLGRVTIRELHRSHEGTHRLEIAKLKEVQQDDLWDRLQQQDKVKLSRLSINANIPEVLVLIREIRLIDMEVRNAGQPDHGIFNENALAPLEDLCSPYGMFHSVYARIHMLRLRTRIHVKNLAVTGLGSELKPLFGKKAEADDDLVAEVVPRIKDIIVALGSHQDKVVPSYLDFHPKAESELQKGLELFEMMLVDAIFCCHEIVRLLRIYGRSYMASHSMKAAAHQELARWCDVLNGYLRFIQKLPEYRDQMEAVDDEPFPSSVNQLRRNLEAAIGPADMVHLSPSFHRETALRHLKSALETHSEGLAYEELLEDMTYLNDDFADQLEHFCAAIERFRINSGYVDHKVLRLIELLKDTSIYAPGQYYPLLDPR